MIISEYKPTIAYVSIGILIACSVLSIGVYQHLTAKHDPEKTVLSYTAEEQPMNNHATPDTLDRAQSAYNAGNMPDAIALYKQALKEEPHLIHILLRLGNAYMATNNFAQAAGYYQSILAIDPLNFSALICAGVAQQHLKQYEQAVTSFQQALAMQPNYYDGHVQLSLIFSSMKEYEKAIMQLKKAINIDNSKTEPYIQLGFVYNKIGETTHAIDAYKKAIALDPRNAGAHQGVGYSLRLQGDMREAIPYLEKAIAAQSDHIDAHIGLAFCHWALGDYEKAWPEYEWRWKMHGMNPEKLDVPLLSKDKIAGSSVLLYYEQGMGDTIQYIRYAQELKKQGARKIVCRVQKPLKKILSLCSFVDQIIIDGEQVKTDYQAPLMSMPLILGTRADSIPCDMPYLTTDAQLVEQWRSVLKKDTNFKIGLCWHVDPIHEEMKSPLAKRSIPLKLFAPLAQLPHVSFYSLQKMAGEDQLKDLPAHFKVTSFGADFDSKNGSFMDSAAVISQLDLVISVDTSVVHIAGALGKPVWTLLPSSPDPRFHTEGEQMPWYPSMKLFRTEKPYDWQTTINTVYKELKKLLNSK